MNTHQLMLLDTRTRQQGATGMKGTFPEKKVVALPLQLVFPASSMLLSSLDLEPNKPV